jgi:WD40 repeat protein/predicted Ser/Thr protein kinase
MIVRMAKTELGIGGADTMASTVDLRPPKDNVAGFDIPGYRIETTLGEGGMGTVYVAEQANPKRRVAIKVLHSRSGQALARFAAEADIMARLDHPGIARVLEAGDAEGHPFLVMEYVDGKQLDRFCQPLPRREKLELFVQLCDAVHHAHMNGVIHRDLKPANVMVTSAGRVVVLDFGVARLSQRSTADTREGDLLGTPIYMSPEQASLKADQVDARTDVYTLGVIMYELACGEMPYDVKDLSVPAITAVVADTPPTPLAKRNVELRGDLDAIGNRVLEKEPARRYQSAAALRDDVRRYLDGLPVSVRNPSAFERAARFVRRRPVVAGSLAAAALGVTVFAAVVTFLWRDATDARHDAEAAAAATEVARAQLETQKNELVLRTARAALARDPTQALDELATMTDRGVDPDAAWAIVDEALALGVSREVVHAHSDEVHWIEPIAGGFVTAGYDGRVLIWDPKPRLVFTAAKGRVHVVVPDPAGKQFAVGGDAGALHVIDRDGKVLASYDGHAGDVQHVAWSPDGKMLASGDDHGHLFVWPGKQLEMGTAPIGTVTWGGNNLLVAGDHDGLLRAWRFDTDAKLETSTHSDIAHLWSDGSHIVAVDGVGVVWRWHVNGAELALDGKVVTGVPVKRVVFATGGTFVMIGGIGGEVVRVEGDKIEKLGLHHSQVRSLAVSPDGMRIADGGDDGSLVVRDRLTGRAQVLRGHAGRIRHVAFSDGGKVLLSSDSDGVVRVWDLATVAATLDADPAPIERVAASATGRMLAAVDENGDVSTWNAETGARTHVGKVSGRTVAIAISGATAVTGTADGVVTWWAKEPVKRTIEGSVKAIAVGVDRVAVATSKGPIVEFELDGTPLRVLPGHPGGSEIVAFDSTGGLLASGGQDRSIRVWKDAAQIAELSGPTGDTSHVAWSPSGDLVVAAGNDGAVRAWRVAGGVVEPNAQVLAQHTGAMGALSVGSTWIVSAGRDAKLMRVKLGSPAETVAIPSGAIRLAVDDSGGVRALTRPGAVVRWPNGGAPVVAVEHGARDLVRYRDASRWAIAFDDGTLVDAPLASRTLAELHAMLAKVSAASQK